MSRNTEVRPPLSFFVIHIASYASANRRDNCLASGDWPREGRGQEQRAGGMNVQFINPFVASTVNVFATSLHCELQRGKLFLKSHSCPLHDVNGIIGLAGQASGKVVLSVSHDVALSATEAMLGQRPTMIDAEVLDAVGELTNMIVGGAKTRLESLNLTMGLPTVLSGKNHALDFPAQAVRFVIPFDSPWGELALEVGLCET